LHLLALAVDAALLADCYPREIVLVHTLSILSLAAAGLFLVGDAAPVLVVLSILSIASVAVAQLVPVVLPVGEARVDETPLAVLFLGL